jgi:hypothetical protein
MRPESGPEAEAAYRDLLGTVAGSTTLIGQHVLIHNGQVVGVFPSQAAAELAWVTLLGPVPAFLRQVAPADVERATAPARPASRAARTGRPRASRPFALCRPGRTPTVQGLIVDARRLRQQAAERWLAITPELARAANLIVACRATVAQVRATVATSRSILGPR